MSFSVRRPRLPRAPKARGELAEALFVVQAIALGFWIAKPFGDSLPFDFILGAGRRIWRIQVKSAWSRHGSSACHFTTELGRSAHRTRPYTRREIDFLVCYAAPDDAWYVIPVDEIARRRQFKIFVGGRSMYNRYRDAWRLFTAPKRLSS